MHIALPIGALAALPAGPAMAQVSGNVEVQNTYRLRGYSISGGHPTGMLNLYYDRPSGMYVNLSALGELGHDASPEWLGYIANIGYARRIGPQLSLDGGLVRTQFSHYASGQGSGAHYTDLYVGLSGRVLSSHLHYSPDYYQSGAATLYGEIDGALQPAEKWQVSGHVGVLDYLTYPSRPTIAYIPRSVEYDWRIGVARQLGAFSLHTDVSGGGPRPERPYRQVPHQGTAWTIGASWVF